MIIIPENIKTIMRTIINDGGEAYIIGGAVRDTLLGLKPHDYDVFTNLTGERLLKLFPDSKIIGNEDRQQNILTVIVDGVEVSQFRQNGDRTEVGTSLIAHQKTCDFTINSIAIDINGEIVETQESHYGMLDIKLKRINFVGNPLDRINEDPLRILRGIRLECKLVEFSMTDESVLAILNTINSLNKLSKERIRDELIKIIPTENGFELLEQFGILKLLIPELELAKSIDGGEEHNENVYEHLVNSFKNMSNITSDYRLLLSALLHDIGKVFTATKDETGTHFFEHESKGADYVERWLTNYKFTNEDINFVSTLVKMHMWHHNDGTTNNNFIKKINILKSAGISVMDFVMIGYADCQGNLKNDRLKFCDFMRTEKFLPRYISILEKKIPFKISDLAINGYDVMKTGLQGKEVGDVLNYIFERVTEGYVINRRDLLLTELKNYINSNYKGE